MTIQREVVKQLQGRRQFTPDFKDEIDNYNKHIVMVWDSFKIGFPSDRTLENCAFLGEAFTVENNYVMRICPTFPIIFQITPEEQKTRTATRVWGEAYALGIHDILRLDAIMDNGGSFIRRRRYIALKDQEWPGGNSERFVTVNAWIYIATPFFQNEVGQNMHLGTQTKFGEKYYWEWRKENMRPSN